MNSRTHKIYMLSFKVNSYLPVCSLFICFSSHFGCCIRRLGLVGPLISRI